MNCTSFSLLDPSTDSNIDKSLANIDSSSTAHLTLNAAINKPSRQQSRDSNNSDSEDLDRSPSVTVLTMGSSSANNTTSELLNHLNSNPNSLNNNSSRNNDDERQQQYHLHHPSRSSSSTTTGVAGLPGSASAATATAATTTGSGTSIHHRFVNRPTSFPSSGFAAMSNRLHLGGGSSSHKSYYNNIWSRATPFEKILMLAIIVLCGTTILLLISLASVLVQQKSQLDLLMNQTRTIMANDMSHEHPSQNYCLTPDCVKVAASVIEAIDTSVDPCDDFYMYSCGDWIKSNPLPDGKSNWGTFSKLWQDNQSIMRAVLEGSDFKPGSAEEKAKIYYDSCLDKNDTVDMRGTKPMQDLLESAGGWNISGVFDVSTWDIQSSLQIYHNQYNRGGLFSWAVGSDERNSTRNIIQLDQGGLGLPSRDYYLNKTDKNVLDAYLIYMIKVAELMGGSNVEEQMKDVLKFEKQLATITIPQDQRRDDERMYHKFTLKELSARSKFLNWTKYFDEAFDYHSKTTISFSSEIRPRQNIRDINERLQYSIANSSSGAGSAGSSLKITSENSKNSLLDAELSASSSTDIISAPTSKQQQSSIQKQHSSSIGRHTISENEQVVIYSPEYFDDLSKLIIEYSSTDRGKVTLANYMAWSVIQSLIATLPKSFRDASKILRKALIGSEGIEVSWRYCVADTNQVMGFALGSLFVRQVFQGKSKERAEEMIYSIRNAFKDNLPNLSWMDDKTRMLAREKADYINQMIGFPDFILNPEKLNGKYEGLELDEYNYFENNIKVNVLSLRENMEKINKPANKTEWEMTPPMVNAYYTPTKNQIVFPAGILQTPFYDLSYPTSLNYGAMGVVMGHELTHAFDDQGREYDKDGNLYQWWCNETLKNFEERVRCFVDQYTSYKIDDSHLNGKQTLGENIADNGGLKAAFRAYEKWAETHTEPQLPGVNLTSKQLFFVGFSQVWCSISTPEALKLQVLNDPHAPAQFRVIGTLSNSYEFSREFNCPLGSNMNPEKKCVVW